VRHAIAFASAALLAGGLGTAAAQTSPEERVQALERENAALKQQLEALRAAAGAAANTQGSPAAPKERALVTTPAQDAQQKPASAVLDSVVVRSRKPLEAVKDVPQSVSVVSGDDLKREESTSLESITKRLANVKWNYGNSSTSSYSIRGLGKIANNNASDPSVGLYVDGVPFAFNQLGYFDFYDLDTVSVSRGPQGFAFGKNATIGALEVRYKRPSFVPSADVSLGYNIYEGQSYDQANGNVVASAAATGGLVDGLLAYRTSLRVNKGGGWTHNKYNPDNQYISSDRVSGRMQFLLTPSPDFEARLAVDVNPRMSENSNIGSTNFFFSQTPATYANGEPNTALTTERRLARPWFERNASYTIVGDYFDQQFIASDSQQGVVTGSNGAWLELGWTLADGHKLSSITAVKDYYFNAFRDDEGTVFDVQTAAGQNIRYAQASQEFRLDSHVGELLDLQSGLLFLKSRNNWGSNAIFGSDGGAWFASDAQYASLDADSAGRSLMQDSLADLWTQGPIRSDNRSLALYGSGDWKLSESFIVNTGLRISNEERELSQSQIVQQQGFGSDLNPASIGGFGVDGTGVLLGTNTAAQRAVADRVAARYFGAGSYAALTPAQQQQVAHSKSIRASRIGTLYDTFTADAVKATQTTWSFSPRYRLNDDVTVYASAAHGEKAGLPRIRAVNGQPVGEEVKPEKNDAFELGFKSTLLNGNLLLNAALFRNDIKDYQQTVFFLDETATNDTENNPSGLPIYVSGPGNVPKVRAQGLEVDAVYTGIRSLELRIAGAYNDARYVSFPTAPLPVERANEGAFYDASGKRLPGASKYTLSVGATWRQPVWGDKTLITSWNTSAASGFSSDNNLSSYSWIKAYSTTDASLGLGGPGGRWDLNLWVKNLFDDDTPRNQTWNAWAPGFPRQVGLTVNTKL
jgi:outer membrane receptor protein involved in Fe transport